MNISDGPAVGLNPNANTAGMIINAASNAESVSNTAVLNAQFGISKFFPA